jgi:hypothetical protein
MGQLKKDYLKNVASYGAAHSGIVDELEVARRQIEERFLEGGNVMMSVLDVLTALLTVLEDVGSALKEDEAEEATNGLLKTSEEITALVKVQSSRRGSLDLIASESRSLSSEIVGMEETLRYLRTFATTAKITGANIPDFAGFAVEIVERIQFASREVQAVSERINSLHKMIDLASNANDISLEQYEHSIPETVDNLGKSAKDIRRQRQALSAISAKVADMTRKVQQRLSSSLSSLQIGDATRQRIEHCQTAFSIAAEHLNTPAGAALSTSERDAVEQIVARLVYEQLDEIGKDFERECKTVIANIHAFPKDVASLMDLCAMMLPANGEGLDGAIHRVQRSLETALETVRKIEKSAEDALHLSQSAGQVVQQLFENVGTIQLVRTDIQYMALNTNLRCSKLGEEGRAINVVTGELRTYSGRLDEAADRVLVNLKQLGEHADGLATKDGCKEDLAGRIEIALSHITLASKALDGHVEELRHCGINVAAKVNGAVSKLDFHMGIQQTLNGCVDQAALAANGAGDLESFGENLRDFLAGISAQIARTYTMKAERDIHASIFGGETNHPEPVATSDEDLFDDALF